MLNQLVVIGRLSEDIKSEEINNKKVASITLAVPRSFKNMEGEYETDFLEVTLFGGVAETTSEHCKKGDLIGIKGRVQSREYEENGTTKKKMEIIAEKVSFLSSKGVK